MSLPSGTPVQIFGQVYHLRGEEDPDHVRTVAALVDRKMNVVATRGKASDSFRIAVLAAIEIADELLRLQDEHDRFRQQIAERRDRLAELLDQAARPRPGSLLPAAD